MSNTQLTLAEMQALAAKAAETSEDMSKSEGGGGGARLLPAGHCFARLVQYVDLGSQPQEFNGTSKGNSPEFRLGFAVYGEGYQNEDGTPYIIRTFDTAMKRFDKATGFKLFKALNWKGTATSFPQLIGEAFLLKIKHVENKTTKKVASRIDLDGFLPPLDPVTKQPYPIPEARPEDLLLFLWDHPMKSEWDKLHIDGTKDDGTSKNFVQEKILGAVNFAGSPLEQMLGGGAASLALPTAPWAEPAAPATEAAVPAVAPPVVPAGIVPPAMPNIALPKV